MTDFHSLYAELKDQLQELAGPLLDFASGQVRKRGDFLPFGATLPDEGPMRLHMGIADDLEDGSTTAGADILPLLHDGLRAAVEKGGIRALAVCESVTITPSDGRDTRAIKVLVEHSRGLTVAFYLPYSKRLIRGPKFGNVMALPAASETGAFNS